jgi:hypothetical protein
MLTNYQQMLLQDLTSPTSYGPPFIGWKGQVPFHRAAHAPATRWALREKTTLGWLHFSSASVLCVG